MSPQVEEDEGDDKRIADDNEEEDDAEEEKGRAGFGDEDGVNAAIDRLRKLERGMLEVNRLWNKEIAKLGGQGAAGGGEGGGRAANEKVEKGGKALES